MWLALGPVASTAPSLSKSQDWPVTTPVDVSAKFTVTGASPEVGAAVKDATGGGGSVTPIVCVVVATPPGPVTLRPTVCSPAVSKVWVALGPVASSKRPSPFRSHARSAMTPVEVSVNRTVRGAVPLGGSEVNEATGAGGLTLIMEVL